MMPGEEGEAHDTGDRPGPMKFSFSPPGLTLFPPHRQEDWVRNITGDQLLAIARRGDELGFEYLFVPWHIAVEQGVWADNMGARWPHSLAASALLLGATRRLTVCPFVVLPCEPPIHLAKAIATMDWMSGGRCAPMLLTGYIKVEFDLLGADFARRNEITDEYVEAMLALWTQEVAEFHGDHVGFSGVAFEPKPAQQPMPLWFGGKASSKRALRRVAKWGSGWLSYASRHAEHPAAVAFIRSQPEYDPSRPLEIAAYFEEPTHDPESHEETVAPDFVVGDDAVVERVHYLASLGVTTTPAPLTAMDDGHGRPAPIRSLEEYLDRMTWFAEAIRPRLG